MDLGLTNQIVAVVGGAQGIGYAIAQEFAQEGASVAITDLKSTVVDSAAAIAHQSNVPAIGLTADVTDYAAMCSAACGLHCGTIWPAPCTVV